MPPVCRLICRARENKLKSAIRGWEDRPLKHEFKEIEAKWQKKWEESHVFEAKNDYTKPKYYALV